MESSKTFAIEKKFVFATIFWSRFSLQISIPMLNEKIFLLLMLCQLIKAETVYYVLASVLTALANGVCLSVEKSRGLPTLSTNQSPRSIPLIS